MVYNQKIVDAVKAIAPAGFLFNDVEKRVSEYLGLGFEDTYSIIFDEKEVARHAYGYLVARAASATDQTAFTFADEGETHAFYFCNANQRDQVATMHRMESWLQKRKEKYGKTHATSIRSYHSTSAECPLTLFTAEKTPFLNPKNTTGTKVEDICSIDFVNQRNPEVRARYQSIISMMNDSIAPVHTVHKVGDMVSLKLGFIPDRECYLTSLITLICSIPNASVVKKFCETFSNGMHVYTFYVKGATEQQLRDAASLITLLPHRPHDPITALYNEGLIDARQVIYCNSLSHFAFYFTPPFKSEDFAELSRELSPKPMSVTRLKAFRNVLFRQIMSYDLIHHLITTHVGLVKMLFDDFAKGPTAESCAKLEVVMKQQMANNTQQEREIFRSFITFNLSVLRTNFFKPNKAAVAYRLDPAFVGKMDYPRLPYGIYLIVGPQFIGFHVRFTDIARGGVRMIISPSENAYNRNRVNLFAENYNLSYAQHMKNKDIPEGGSKGTILVEPSSTYDKKRTFLQYIDALCDLIVPNTEGITGPMKAAEILFLGPDENTAGAFPAVAAMHAKARGYKQWKSFTTGKSPTLGGIPHDTYGMTSRGVRACVEGVYEKLALTETNLTKFQTGGPDGDLGSNEVKLSKEKYIGMVDGSGSIYDPEGLNRQELLRLATERKMLKHFDAAKLSPKGFFVAVADKNRTLPDGTLVQDGESFRNTFHFSKFAVADVFVPCGGRPASISLDNVHKLISVQGATGQSMIEGKVGNLAGTDKLRFKYIVEGANLFITHDARIALESVGVVLVKDSSANKAGVTCSSFEVLAGMCMTDAEHANNMCVRPDGTIPEVYKQYVEEVIQVLGRNAKKEFECLWNERKKGTKGGLMTLISDELSGRIVQMRQFIINSDLHKDAKLFRYVMSQYVPTTLQQKVPIDKIIDRLPENYKRAMFAITIASDYNYKSGLAANEFSFFQYMHDLIQKSHAAGGAKL